MNKSYPRSRRVGDQIQRTLSELLRREVRDPRLGPVTITEVRVSQDLSHAKIFYSVLGAQFKKDDRGAALTQEILDAAAAMLRGRIGRALGLRHAPELHFEADTLIDEGARMSTLIKNAVKQDAARHADDLLADSPDPAADSKSPKS